jgi:hypothetical protein
VDVSGAVPILLASAVIWVRGPAAAALAPGTRTFCTIRPTQS